MLDREQPVTLEHSLVHPEGLLSRRNTFPTGQLQLMDAHKSIRFVAACGKTPSVVVSDRQ